MAANKIILSLMVLYLATQVQSSYPVSKSLVNYIRSNSDPDVIPRPSLDTPAKVKSGLYLVNIRDVDQASNQLVIDAWLQFEWNSLTTFEPEYFNNMSYVRIPASSIWVPDLVVGNGEITQQDPDTKRMVVMRQDGSVFWVAKTTIRVGCDLAENLVSTNATCVVDMGSLAYSAEELFLDGTPFVDAVSYEANSKYEILGTSSVKITRKYSCCPEDFESALFTFSFRRK